jgi:hypothetical protein
MSKMMSNKEIYEKDCRKFSAQRLTSGAGADLPVVLKTELVRLIIYEDD